MMKMTCGFGLKCQHLKSYCCLWMLGKWAIFWSSLPIFRKIWMFLLIVVPPFMSEQPPSPHTHTSHTLSSHNSIHFHTNCLHWCLQTSHLWEMPRNVNFIWNWVIVRSDSIFLLYRMNNHCINSAIPITTTITGLSSTDFGLFFMEYFSEQFSF